jgi:glutamyl-tRNA synthetase
MNTKQVRVRFAPSPTGGLHLGGIRTVLYNYLFAKKHNGTFILRIEDTDQTRFVAGAEEYINNTLAWCGIEPDESVTKGGNYGPYKQSERKAAGIYQTHADALVKNGFAYLAFDTPEELETMRNSHKTASNPSPQYDATIRMQMRNSLSLSNEEVEKLLASNMPYVVRIKMPQNETITFTDLIRGQVNFDSNLVDDKVLLKTDGMPTYHLAVVVDDYLMQITHAFRGEEWLPSAPVHILLWQYLGWQISMPQWAHLPLILGPNGKLSKRDGAKYGFPVFGLTYTDPNKNEVTEGFKERGFLPQAFLNLLAVLGWNDGTDKELFSLKELIENFSIERVHSAGAKFDFEKALWFNTEWIKQTADDVLLPEVKAIYTHNGVQVADNKLLQIIAAVKDRCHLLPDFFAQGSYFVTAPTQWDLEAVTPKWTAEKADFFAELIKQYQALQTWNAIELEEIFKALATEKNIKPGELQLPMRIMLVGAKFGPGVFSIAEIIEKVETIKRIELFLKQL